MKTLKVGLCAAAVALAGLFAFAEENVLWVDDDAYGAEVQDGSETNPYGTIQDAIDAAGDNWTIYVKPGTYDKGGATPATPSGQTADCMARVLVKRPLKIIATGSATNTFIVGAADTDPDLAAACHGCGTNAVRCVRFATAAAKSGVVSVLKGFTIKDGHCSANYKTYNDPSSGYSPDWNCGQPGGVAYESGSYGNGYVVDCVITNCYGVRSAAIRYGKCVRCSFYDCTGIAGNGYGRDTSYISCFFNHATQPIFTCNLLNCTLFDSKTVLPVQVGSGGCNLYNTLFASIALSSSSVTATAGTACNSALPFKGIDKTETDCLYGTQFQLFAPLTGDYRVRADAESATLGSAERLTTGISNWFSNAPDIVEIRKGIDDVTFPTEGSIPVGCCAETVAAAGGAIYYSGNAVVCQGHQTQVHDGTAQYAFSQTAYDVLQVKPVAGKYFHHFNRTIAQGGAQFPEMDESVWSHFPPKGIVVTNIVRYAESEVWVDPAGSDATGDGTETKPYKTLTNAVQKAGTGRALIRAAAGDYDEGCYESATDGRSRVSLFGTNIRLKGAGRGKSFIIGEPDPDTDPTALDRRGPKAIRCAQLDSYTGRYNCIQGFTLTNGYANTGTESAYDRQGGLVLAAAATKEENRLQVADCELIGGQAYRSGQVQCTTLTRCIIRGWRLALAGHAVRSARLDSCIFHDYADDIAPLDDDQVYHLTGLNETGSAVNILSGNDNCVSRGNILYEPYMTADVDLGMATCEGTFYWTGSGTATEFGTDLLRKADPAFVDVANRDFRIKTTSAICTNRFAVNSEYWKHAATDVYGTPFDFTSGKEIPGAIATPVQALVTKTPTYGTFTVTGDGKTVGETTLLNPGESATVTFTPDASGQRVDAVLTNGVVMTKENPQTPYETIAFTCTCDGIYAADGSVAPGFVFTVQYATNWYVNANAATDGNGYTPETAWNTLAHLTDTDGVRKTYDGDWIHAAPGDYNKDGSYAGYTDETYGSSCVKVPDHRTLVADEGPEKTWLYGKKGSGTYGRGDGAMRCVYVGTYSSIRGFTLANGYTSGTATDDKPLYGGGGFVTPYAVSHATYGNVSGMAYGCVFTNCVAARGGAAYRGRIFNCKILYCHGHACNSTGGSSLLYGCYIDGCQQNQWCRNAIRVIRCTFGPNNITGANPFDGCSDPIENCVVMRSTTMTDTYATRSKNCLFLDGATWTEEMKALTSNCKWFSTYADMGLSADGHPLAKTSAVVDAAKTATYTNYDTWLEGRDADGNQRIYNNSKCDIGAYEYDWRGDYATDLGDKATVVSADPKVTETDGKVLVKGGTLALKFNDKTNRGRYEIPFEVTGTGTLTLKAGDTVIGTYDASSGAQKLTYKVRQYGTDLVFTYAPGASDTAGALLSAITGGARGFAIFFH